MKRNGKLIISAGCFIGTVILIILLRLVDVAPIGPNGTDIGLSHINQFFFNLSGVNLLWYNITDWLGIIAILTAFLFAASGLIQLIKRKGFLKVDREILSLGGLYLIAIGLYILFEKAIVNYRPIIMPGCTQPEASFPSSHTMMVCIVMGSTVMLIGRYIKNKPLCKMLKAICALAIGVTVIGRLISGVHWFTDIIGGMLISVSLLSLFSAIGICNNEHDEYRR
jgi:undecaprenyl-diphosphatase